MSPRPASTCLGAFLGLEGLALAVVALATRCFWLLPACGLAIVFAGLVLGRFRASLALSGLGITCVWFLWHPPIEAKPLSAIYPIAATLLGIGLNYLTILADNARNEDKVAQEPHRALRLALILHFLAAGLFFADFRGYFPSPLAFSWGCALIAIFASIDVLWHSLIRIYTPDAEVHFQSWLSGNGKQNEPEETRHTTSLAAMWMWPTIRSGIVPLVCLVALLFWLSTSLHIIPPGHQGVRSHWGRVSPLPLDPGIHTSLPWPLGAVTAVPTAQIRQIVLGFQADPGQPILWEKAHYIGEEMSLVGAGDDFLSISVPIFYHIGNPADYLLTSTAPESMLRELGQRTLLQLTVHRPATEIMTTSRETLRVTMREMLQRELDNRKSGLVLDDVYFRDIHPPVAVAPAYQEVVSSVEEKEATIHESEQYRLEHLPAATGEARRIILKAEAAANTRQSLARGQAQRFDQEAKSRAQSPSLFELREGFRVFDSTLAGAKKIITNDTIEAGSMPLHLDLRRVLNRRLVDQAAPQADPLIFNPSEPKESFDLNVEGYH